ncbi:Ig-like domain repeat protein, partial [bacterium]|nr:Ig-like domain repeat protein [bacterium]
FPHKRLVSFSIDNGIISPEITYLNNGIAYAILNSDFNNDFKAYARIDNQLLEVNVRNTHTNIIIEDTIFKGKSNKYSVTLVNVNGYKISNQTLLVEVNGDSFNQIFTIVTDEEGHAEFNVDYPIGVYNLSVKYLGNGYFIKSSANAKIEVVVSMTALRSYDHVYYGKNNRFSAILTGENENKLSNLTLTFTITDSQGHSTVLTAKTDNYGIGEILLVLEIGEYDILTEFKGDSWYSYSNSTAHIIVNPVNTTIIAPDITFYGDGNQYNITLKDIYGNIVSEENIYLTISKNGINDKFTLKTNEFGVASLTINYLPGTYYLHIDYNGDEVYGASKSDAIIKIEKVLTVISGFSHTTIPIGGVYTVILSDMYGKRVNGEKIILNIYKGNLIKQYVLECDANGEASFKIDLGEGTYLATIDYEGNLWYSDSTNAATIVVSNDVKLQDISINGSDLVQYYGEDEYFIIKFNDPNVYSQYGKNIVVTLSSGTWSSSYTLNTDVYGIARLKITLNPGEYNITYKYSNNYYGLFASGSNKI